MKRFAGFTWGLTSDWIRIGLRFAYSLFYGTNRLNGDMGIQQKLHTKLVQKLILTPSLQQAIKLLPMSTL